MAAPAAMAEAEAEAVAWASLLMKAGAERHLRHLSSLVSHPRCQHLRVIPKGHCPPGRILVAQVRVDHTNVV